MKYVKYLAATGMTNNDVIAILQPHFPKFSKIQCSMIANPDKYGVQLTAKAAALLPPTPRKPQKRKGGKRVTVYLDEASYNAIKERAGAESPRQYLENIIATL